MHTLEPVASAETVADLTARLALAERVLVARDKTIQALVTREKDRAAKRSSTFAVMEENAALQQVVARKTLELEARNRDLQQTTNALRASEVRYRSLFDNAAEAVWLLTDTFLDCNESACELWGCNREDIIGHSPAEFSPPMQPDGKDSAQAAKERTHAALAGQPQLFYWQHKRKDGTLVDTEISLTDLTIGEQRLILAMGRDITERRRTQAQMENLQKQLLDTSRNAGMAEVATNVLHNVGNVLNSVNVSATLVVDIVKKSKISSLAKIVGLLREHEQELGTFVTSDPRGKQLPTYLAQLSEQLLIDQKATIRELDSLRRNIDHIKEIVAMQQNFARLGGLKEMISVVNLVEDSIRLNEGALSRQRVEVIREFETVPPINVEKHKILQILVNLLRNAKHACQETDRADKRLTVRVANGDGRIKISVSDNGIGIPPENLTRIFEHGFTTRKEGHGFGLHSSALAAKEMGGSLSAHSDGPGRGATFTLSLPLQQEHKEL
jgi:PAS domain S-box-containing protein